ncbi:MAG: DUF1612 and helix-turn-helix domain-containing protein [Rhizobiaceae bacterium]|nr:DUF1612 and helix-turn-helix domain-containing protein [Rhizobiaceae bacterium]
MSYEIGILDLDTLLPPIAAAESQVARLDERVARSEVGQGFAERADFFDSVSNMWVAGELVHIEDLVLHDARMDIRTPTHELVVAHRIIRARRRIFSNEPGWAISRAGISVLSGLEDGEASVPEYLGGGGEAFEDKTYDVVDDNNNSASEFAEIDAVLARTAWLSDKAAEQPQVSQPRETNVGDLIIRDPDWDEKERLSIWLDLVRQVAHYPATLAAAILWDAWEDIEPLQRQHWLGPLLVSAYLRSRSNVASHLFGFAVGLRAIPRERRRSRDRTIRLVAYLDAMQFSADAGIKEIDRLTLAKRQMERRLNGKRSSSSLPAGIDLILSRPIVSASMIATAAKITPRGALNLIAELNVRELTGRGRYRAWGVL